MTNRKIPQMADAANKSFRYNENGKVADGRLGTARKARCAVENWRDLDRLPTVLANGFKGGGANEARD